MIRRRLDVELVRRGITDTRAQAQTAISEQRVLVGGAPALTNARRVGADESISLSGPEPRFVSRGGEKLSRALEEFSPPISGAYALDAGASTGGFTDCLLQNGVAHVTAVDVGRGQLAWRLRNDDRVTLRERTNVRYLEPTSLISDQPDGRVDLVVADLSFISILTVAPALVRCTTEDAHLIVLVKPQFEAGRSAVGRGGIVRDPSIHREVMLRVCAGLTQGQLPVVAATVSPLTGADGNREFLVHIDRAGTPMASDAIEAIAVA